MADLRGNLDTRLKKLEENHYDAIVLAYAGLYRMGWESKITEVLPFDICLPAVGQGALAIQCRKDDRSEELLRLLDHAKTRQCVSAERALLAHLGAGCQTPVAALAIEHNGEIKLDAMVASLDGSQIIRMSNIGKTANAEEIGVSLAKRLLGSNAGELLDQARNADLKGMGAA
jgi:hydroxymethylbilane synthase